jgi:sugar fermentation stimulation protein A
MIYQETVPAIFLSRPNRFIAIVSLHGTEETVHVKNTGRCKELLIPGVWVILARAYNPHRKTRYDLVAVQKGTRLINMDSQAPNQVFSEYIITHPYIKDLSFAKREVTHGDSRFDFYAGAGKRRIFIEVKGVTLEEDGVALFPDAPTLRGVKHLHGLIDCVKEGYEARMVFVIQMEQVRYFTPNNITHPAFGAALAEAIQAGVMVSAFDCMVTPRRLMIHHEIPVRVNPCI